METRMERAAALRERALRVIGGLGLMERWSRIGRPVLVGSVRFGLMANTNIDLEVYVPEPRVRDGFGVIAELAERPGIRRIQYLNVMGTDDPGLYWRVDCEDGGELWDIDIWLVPDDHPHAGLAGRFASAMERALTEETRDAILALKAARPPGSKIRGIDVYRAVLAGNVRTDRDFQVWLADHSVSDGIEEWMP